MSEAEQDVLPKATPSACVGRSDRCLATMYAMRPALCDVTLVTDDATRITAHRVVLASSLNYFSAMFVGFADASGSGHQFTYLESEQAEICIKNIDGHALNQIIHWCYTGAVDVNEHNVQQLLGAAKMLDAAEIVNACSEFIRSQLLPENALGIFQFAEMLGCTDLEQYALNYIYNHFVLISTTEEFVNLDERRLVDILSSDFIDAGERGEQSILTALMTWIEHCPTERRCRLPVLIQHIRFPRLNQETLVAIEDEFPLLKSDTTCKDLLIEAMKYHLCKGQLSGANINATNPRYRMRAPIGRPKCLVVVGGQAPKAIRQCEFFDFTSERWYDLRSELPSRRCRAGLAVHGGIIYAIGNSPNLFSLPAQLALAGGFNGSLRLRSVDAYDPQADQWITCPSMEARRSTLGVSVLNDKIYAIGGFGNFRTPIFFRSHNVNSILDGSTGLNSCEVFTPQTGQWTPIAPMSTKRSSVGVATLGDYLYAVGGYGGFRVTHFIALSNESCLAFQDGGSRQCLASVEYYDPSSDSWHLIPDMSQRRSGAGVGVLDGKLYVFGGHGKRSFISLELWAYCVVSRRSGDSQVSRVL